MKKITIIGAGIGGLTTAIALQQKGFDVEIFESTPEFKKAGSGINLAINAMQVFDRLGIAEEIYAKSNHTTSMNVRKKNLDIITRIGLEKYEKSFGVKTVAIHRSELHHILLNNINNVNIQLTKPLWTISP